MMRQNSDFSNDKALIAKTQRGPLASARRLLRRLSRDQRGAALIEYTMISVCVGVFCYEGVKLVGGNVEGAMKNVSEMVGKLQKPGK